MLQFESDKPIEVILPIDPAVLKINHDKYLKSRFDPQYVTLKEGEKPSLFKIRQLTHKSRAWADGFITDFEKQLATVRWGLLDVQNCGELKTIEREPNIRAGGDVITEQWMNEEFTTARTVIYSLSQCIEAFSDVTPFF